MNIGKVAFKLTRAVTFGLASLRGIVLAITQPTADVNTTKADTTSVTADHY